MAFTYRYPRPAIAADIVVFGYRNQEIFLLLIERDLVPFKGMWALPGGFVKDGETLGETAKRELFEEAGVQNLYLEQFHVFDDIKRDPRERVLSVAFFALVKPDEYFPESGTDASDARWFKLSKLPKLAFDHQKIIEFALRVLQEKIKSAPIAFELLPNQFTLSDLQILYETLLGQKRDKRNFRKKILSLNILKSSGKKQEQVAHRSPELFQLNLKNFGKLKQEGFKFGI